MRKASVFFISMFIALKLAMAEEQLSQSLDESWLKAVVSIEQGAGDKARPIGTGFVLITEKGHQALVTAAHVVFEGRVARENLLYRVASASGGTVPLADAVLQKAGTGSWFRSETDDVALRFFGRTPEMVHMAIPVNRLLPSKALRPGNPGFIVGFPLGLRSTQFPNPIVRRATIARADSEELLADGFVFPGNSGGPVLYVPPLQFSAPFEVNYSQETAIIGIVSEAITYQEVAISPQSGRPRITFEDNTGLARLVPTEAVIELLRRQDVVQTEEKLSAKAPNPSPAADR